jgi:hypothetical protein
MTMRKVVSIFILLLIAGVYFVLLHRYSPTRGAEYTKKFLPVKAVGPSIEIGGTIWTEAMRWDFSDGFYPTGWSWGDWEIVDGYLVGKEAEGLFAVYFFPYTHGGNVLLETKVQFIRGAEQGDARAYLLTRDSDDLNFESGMALLANTDVVHLRHMAEKHDYIDDVFPSNGRSQYGDWYVMQFAIHDYQIQGYVNGFKIDAWKAGLPEKLPVGVYQEPHLAVSNGEARFEYVKIYFASE